ncbi:MAG: hypothetical protein HRF40_00530 [Nitrososphaera sp.]
MPIGGIHTSNKSEYHKLEKLLEDLLTPADLILLVLSVAPVKGNTRMQKQVFIAYKELFEDKAVDPVYYPWKYGAYSKVVEDTVKLLTKQGYIKVFGRRGEGTIYSITKKGQDRINLKIDKLRLNLSELASRKARWDEWTPIGTLRYVYRVYPEYTTKTKVPRILW